MEIWRRETCWLTETADRAAFLVDYQTYFSAAYEAILKARRSIVLLGWGFDPRTRLAPDGADVVGEPDEIGRVLLQVAEDKPYLDIRLLVWKSALPISATQEFFPHKAREWFKGSIVKFYLDDTVPFGACHHQKVLIIDDHVAFVSSGDFCIDRWDSTSHRHEDIRRRIAHHGVHAPRHEVTALVDGAAARALALLANERWREATKEEFELPPPVDGDPWPDFVTPTMRKVKLGIARTLPAWHGRTETTEIQALTLASINQARKLIYLENQYFTAPVIAEALAARLTEPYGPEIVLISTRHAPSWFDRLTMDRARGIMIRRLQEADIFGRFRAYSPVTTGGRAIIVHSKLCIIDDELVRVGSANLNHRSGGFDTELEIGLEAKTDDHRTAIAGFRNELVGHFLARDAAAVAKEYGAYHSLINAIDILNRHGRLIPIKPRKLDKLSRIVAEFHLGDPTNVRDSFRPYKRRRSVNRQVHTIAAEGGVMRFLRGLQSRLLGEDGRTPPE